MGSLGNRASKGLIWVNIDPNRAFWALPARRGPIWPSWQVSPGPFGTSGGHIGPYMVQLASKGSKEAQETLPGVGIWAGLAHMAQRGPKGPFWPYVAKPAQRPTPGRSPEAILGLLGLKGPKTAQKGLIWPNGQIWVRRPK